MAYSPSPLAVIENHFTHLSSTHLTLQGSAMHPWLEDRVYSLHELRGVLMGRGTPNDVRDAVWQHTVRAARHSQDWMVGALGLGMPMLRATAAQACRHLSRACVDEIESVVVVTAIEQIRVINLGYRRLVYFLRCRVHRAAMGARKRALSSTPPMPVGVNEEPGSEAEPATSGAGSPDLALFAAVRAGVSSEHEADLIARTRLEDTPLADMAAESGVAYKTLAKRRQRAEERLVAAVRSGALRSGKAEGEPEKKDPGSVADVRSQKKAVVSQVSNSRLPMAS
ncbi:hypothetical protein HNR06_000933 [Nocardiopsis arvandica]|uniref:Uncharacterized protein n=1 Tax=Nocardiopsis sinuspersici TaxID=501010 RepID=A0A7Y9X9A5_9ACTN|nr:sigma-70 family RNA polymerase sigma factor [Nocardiopsis sinuspersici]NYH51344.1 hypothetical protein [Nocardiopsis sinuspersici]